MPAGGAAPSGFLLQAAKLIANKTKTARLIARNPLFCNKKTDIDNSTFFNIILKLILLTYTFECILYTNKNVCKQFFTKF
jgi:hypothetical protein